MLGGFWWCKGDGEPGVKTIWQGLQRIVDAVQTLRWRREAQNERIVCKDMLLSGLKMR